MSIANTPTQEKEYRTDELDVLVDTPRGKKNYDTDKVMEMGERETKIQNKKIKFMWIITIGLTLWAIFSIVNVIHHW